MCVNVLQNSAMWSNEGPQGKVDEKQKPHTKRPRKRSETIRHREMTGLVCGRMENYKVFLDSFLFKALSWSLSPDGVTYYRPLLD